MELTSLITSLILLSILSILPYSKMEVFDQSFEADLNAFVEKTMDCRHVPGLTISVVKGSDTWTRGYGTADFSTGRKVDNSTLFNIGSVTKSFTMVLLGVLLTEKEMDWNDKIIDILGPNYEFIDEYRTREMTLRDLLSHRSGLAGLDIGLLAGLPDRLTREKFCRKMKYLPEQLPFRDAFIYNNFMFMMLGHVAEKLGGDTWENLVTSKVLIPIGMTSTRILKTPTDVLKDDMARPYIFKDNMFQNGTLDIYSIYPTEPAGAILSTGEDMAKYIRFNLKYGMTEDGTQLLDLDLMLKAFKSTTPMVDRNFLKSNFLTAPEFPVSDTPMGYGHAWFTSTYNGYRRTRHSGGLFSYITRVWMFPDINAGVFASVNGPAFKKFPGYALTTILYYISDNLIGQKPWINETTTCDYPEPWTHKSTNSTPEEPSVTLASPSDYVGTYGSKYLPGLQVSEISEDKSSLSFQMNRLGGLLHSTPENDRFLMEVTSPWEFMTSFTDDNNVTLKTNATFLRSEGQVTSLEIQFEVKVVYTKDIDILNDDVSSIAVTYTQRNTLGMIVLMMAGFQLYKLLYY